jgi:ribosome-associated protein
VANAKILPRRRWRNCASAPQRIHRNQESSRRLSAAEEAITIVEEQVIRYRMKKNELKKQVAAAIQACLEKKAEELSILEMEKGSGAFTDYFVLCSGTNPRQVQAISDEVELQLKKAGIRPNSVEGYKQAEWVLIDYVDFVVHVFSEKARKYYDLERLWKSARKLEPGDLKAAARVRKSAAKPAAAKKKKRVKA